MAVKRAPHPGPPVLITLKPGTTVFAGLKWSACAKSDPTCHILSGRQLTPPDETTPLIADVRGGNAKPVVQLLVSATGLTTGPLQPSNQCSPGRDAKEPPGRFDRTAPGAPFLSYGPGPTRS
ncbi:DUF4232 domain-containing protein [Kitasatospora sp. NPDC001159]